MDLEQIIKRLEWLDDERRKDKLVISTFEERILALEGNIPAFGQQIKELNTEVARLSAMLGRFDQIEASITQLRVDTSRSLETVEKERTERERELERVRRADQETVNKNVAEVRKGLEPILDLKKGVQARVEEDFRLGRLIEELEQKIQENQHGEEEYRRALKLLEEGRRQDSKRLSDVQAELGALRKRADEQRGKVDVTSDSVRKLELRISDLQTSESERRQAQNAFLEKINMSMLERDRTWKEWQTSFNEIIEKAVNLDAQLQLLDATHRAVKRSQESFDEITQRFDRRVNEITEMQRLIEERFRQEWVAFKSDDQKRWTNYSLSQEEQQREMVRRAEKINERVVTLEDGTQELHDTMAQVIEEIQKRLQDMLALSRTWVEQYERTLGRSR
jgi:chromosome segregation ATPase